jgi:hypothetical protein
MGSLLDFYVRQRDLRNFMRTQEAAIAAQLSAVDDQVRRIIAQGACGRSELGRSIYLHHYLVGMLDAITSFYERETRKRLGLDLFRNLFNRYLEERFLVPRFEADTLFAAVRSNEKDSGMKDGYSDGLLALRGKPARRLLDTFIGGIRHVPLETHATSPLAASM